MSIPPLTVDWRGGSFSDWECRVGDRRYALHKSVLASSSRSSSFFLAAFNEQYESGSTDLTEVLPLPCHEHFETVLDFMYGHEMVIDTENALQVWKIADVLQIDSLLPKAQEAIEEAAAKGRNPRQTWNLARQCQLPGDQVDRIFDMMEPSEAILAVAESPGEAAHTELLSRCAKRVKRLESDTSNFNAALPLFLGHQVTIEKGVQTISVNGLAMFPLGLARLQVSSCRVRIIHWARCFAGAIGVSSERAERSRFAASDNCARSGSFAHLRHCWGLHFRSQQLFSEGHASTVNVVTPDFTGRVIRLVLNKDEGYLRFYLEEDLGADVELGTIVACFAEKERFFFAASTCCSGCKFQLLESRGQPARGSA